ncbi:hypothetical protein ONZ51_g8010 [Trametes cubensis]|uniref:TauD/TfdA-like domain-containing protein n=1 Tax=Trametes cubensis TaxID=1111947 RepID=A0AAD7X8M1_9APHY|nr:hypothetical protein ONZ51_g8010 [Trametes cubensis]
MAPVATAESNAAATNGTSNGPVKAAAKASAQLFNPFYSPDVSGEGDDSDYQYAKYKPHWPDVKWEPLGEIAVTDRGQFADPEKKSLLSAASKVQHLTPAIGTELSGIDLRQLTDQQKDELALLVAERGVVFFRDQELNIHEQLDLARHFGPLHKHATTPVPREPGLEEVHVVYNDGSRRPDPSAFSKLELWHSDVSYEQQPPSATSLKVITGPPYGGDTLWSSGYALYSSFSAGFQKYLEGLSAVHSAVAQADGARAAGRTVRREPVETVHPVVRVHPVTGWKSIYVNPGFTRRIVGLPKAESDAILSLLFHQISPTPTGRMPSERTFVLVGRLAQPELYADRPAFSSENPDFQPLISPALMTPPSHLTSFLFSRLPSPVPGARPAAPLPTFDFPSSPPFLPNPGSAPCSPLSPCFSLARPNHPLPLSPYRRCSTGADAMSSRDVRPFHATPHHATPETDRHALRDVRLLAARPARAARDAARRAPALGRGVREADGEDRAGPPARHLGAAGPAAPADRHDRVARLHRLSACSCARSGLGAARTGSVEIVLGSVCLDLG